MSTDLKTQNEGQVSKMAQENYIRPTYWVHNDEKSYYVDVNMPGVTRDNANITLHNSELIIEGTRETRIDSNWKTLHRESRDGNYRLRLQLNAEIDGDNISARAENGVLRVTLPVAKEAQPKKISVE